MLSWGSPPVRWLAIVSLLLLPAVTESFFSLPDDPLNLEWLARFTPGFLAPPKDQATSTTSQAETTLTTTLSVTTSQASEALTVGSTTESGKALTTESPSLFRFFQYYTPAVYAGTKSIFTEYVNSLTGAYTLIVKDYVADYYTNAIRSYTRATLKMFGWATFGVFLIIKGLVLDTIYDKVYCNGYYVSEDCYEDFDDYDDYNTTSSNSSSSYTTSSYTTTTTLSSSGKLVAQTTTEKQQGQLLSTERPAFNVLSSAKTPSTDGDVLSLIKQFLKESGRIETLETLDKESSRLASTRPTEPPTRRSTRRPAERPTRRPSARPTRTRRPSSRATTRRPPNRRPTTRRTTARPVMEFEYYEEDSEYSEYEGYDYDYDYDDYEEQAEKLEIK